MGNKGNEKRKPKVKSKKGNNDPVITQTGPGSSVVQTLLKDTPILPKKGTIPRQVKH